MTSEIAVLRDISTAVVRERDIRRMLGKVIEILDRSMGMRRGTFTLLEGDELKIEASSSEMNAEEKSLGTYRLGEGITGLVAKTGKSEIVPDIRKDRRFLNRTRTRGEDDALSFVCVPLLRQGQVIGTLSADRAIDGEYEASLKRDVAFLEIIANLTAEAAAVLREECAERDKILSENRELRGMISDDNRPRRIIGDCTEMRAVYEQIAQVAPSDATVLIRGPSGTGKSSSRRR